MARTSRGPTNSSSIRTKIRLGVCFAHSLKPGKRMASVELSTPNSPSELISSQRAAASRSLLQGSIAPVCSRPGTSTAMPAQKHLQCVPPPRQKKYEEHVLVVGASITVSCSSCQPKKQPTAEVSLQAHGATRKMHQVARSTHKKRHSRQQWWRPDLS